MKKKEEAKQKILDGDKMKECKVKYTVHSTHT